MTDYEKKVIEALGSALNLLRQARFESTGEGTMKLATELNKIQTVFNELVQPKPEQADSEE
jgi:Asp-tRNA(Asn)/Glu-tRNA(Gln) amidotransferase C subunit